MYASALPVGRIGKPNGWIDSSKHILQADNEILLQYITLASSQSYTTGYLGTGPEDGQRAVGQVTWSRLATHPDQSGVQITISLSHSPPSTNQS